MIQYLRIPFLGSTWTFYLSYLDFIHTQVRNVCAISLRKIWADPGSLLLWQPKAPEGPDKTGRSFEEDETNQRFCKAYDKCCKYM